MSITSVVILNVFGIMVVLSHELNYFKYPSCKIHCLTKPRDVCREISSSSFCRVLIVKVKGTAREAVAKHLAIKLSAVVYSKRK